MRPLQLASALIASSTAVLANFHVSSTGIQWLTQLVGWDEACPSNFYNCQCFGPSQERGAKVISGSPNGDFFSVAAGLCSMPQLNFYKRDDGHWDFYVNNGDGSLQGTCYWNSADWSTSCNGASVTVHDYLVCYSYICE